MNVPPPLGDDAWAECLRDLKRTLEGGGIFVVGRERRSPVDDPAKESGDVSQAACERAFKELSKRVVHEMVAQAKGLPPDQTAQGACLTHGCVRPGAHEGPCIDGNLAELRSAVEECGLTRESLEAAMKRMAAYISVTPGMQAIMKHSLPPSLWQPAFAICVGHGQLRVLTLAFVGEPVSGDRPSCKCTPFVLRLLSGDLAITEGAVAPASYCVRPAIRGIKTVASHLAALEPELFEAADGGDWAAISESATGASTASSRCPSVAPSTPARPAASLGPKARAAGEPQQQPVHVGDRAARMRATLERAQSRPAGGRVQAADPKTPLRPRERASTGPTATPARAAVAQSPFGDRTPSVSVLADGLSVKSVAGAWNNVAATTGKIGSLFRRARSPAWLRPRGDEKASARGEVESSAKRLLPATARQQPEQSAPAAPKQPQPPPPQQQPPPPQQQQPQRQQEVPVQKVSALPAAAVAAPAQTFGNFSFVAPAPAPAPVAAVAPVAVVAAAPAPTRQVVDRAARMRERISRAQSTQAGKRHLLDPKLARTLAVGA